MIMMMSMMVHDEDGDGDGGAIDDDDVPFFKDELALYCCVLVVEPAGDCGWPELLEALYTCSLSRNGRCN